MPCFPGEESSWNSGASDGQQGCNLLQPCASEFLGNSTHKSHIWALQVPGTERWSSGESQKALAVISKVPGTGKKSSGLFQRLWRGCQKFLALGRRAQENSRRSGCDVRGFLALRGGAQDNPRRCGADEGRSCSDPQPSPVTDSVSPGMADPSTEIQSGGISPPFCFTGITPGHQGLSLGREESCCAFLGTPRYFSIVLSAEHTWSSRVPQTVPCSCSPPG